MNYIENTRYGYKNAEGHRIHVSTVGADRDHVEIAIAGIGDLGWRSLNIPATEAPGIALALLRAAGFGIRGGLPAPETWTEAVELAVGQLDDAAFMQHQADAKAELTRRRDALAADHGVGGGTYETTSIPGQSLIDMIIQLQDEATQ